MNLETFIYKLNLLKEELGKKEIVIISHNMIEFEPQIKLVLKDKYDVLDTLNHNTKNIDKLVITW